MKNWPLVQKARTIMARPEMSPNHQRSFACRSENAPISQKTPIVRKMKPRMSATAANVCSGCTSEIRPAMTSRAPKIHSIHRNHPPASVPSTRFCVPATRNMTPVTTPTVATEASSNWRTTSATTTQVMPVSSQSHQRLAIWRKGSGGVVSIAIAMRGMITQGPDGGRCRRSGGRELVDHAGEQAPEALDGGDAHALVGRVRRFDLRAERDHVQARHPLADDGRLEPGVYRCDDRGMAEQPLVDAAGRGEHTRVQVGSPS